VCGCTPTSCAAQGKNCGSIPNGCGGTLSCGACVAPNSCGGGGAPNVCGCTPTSCAAQGLKCGSIDKGCGARGRELRRLRLQRDVQCRKLQPGRVLRRPRRNLHL
jgi:hypothetical protein